MKKNFYASVNSPKRLFIRFFYTLICLLLVSEIDATVRRVKVGSPGGFGFTWETAYSSLQSAITFSSAGDEIWIAQGTYQPASTNSFSMKNGVKIYGGFAGNEASLNERNWKTNVVRLRGNNASVFINNGVNSTAELNGVTITGGIADNGGGMYNTNSSSPTITNVIFEDNKAYYYGGGMWTADGNPTLTNVVFKLNIAGYSDHDGYGGGMYNDEAYPTLVNVVFDRNVASRDGGGMSNYNATQHSVRKPRLTNVVFSGNQATNGVGGGIFNNISSAVITNCTFFNNTCGIANAGAAINNYSPAGSSVVPASVITNCMFWGNFSGPNENTTAIDVAASNANPTYTYSAFTQAILPAGAGNVSTPFETFETFPFTASFNPFGGFDLDGEDNVWMTADDGLQLSQCFSEYIDKGNNSAITTTTDILGLSRKVDNGLISDGGSGTAPIVDMGAYESQLTTTISQIVGSISGAHTIPDPNELIPDFVTSTSKPAAGMTIRWEKNENNNNGWVAADVVSPPDSVGYRLPTLTVTTLFRRVVTSAAYCNIKYASNQVQIKVVTPNGAIIGRVVSKNGTPVKGIAIRVQRLGSAISGSPANYTYTDTTADDGTYVVSPIYYGDPSINTSTATFRVTPVKEGHGFNFSYLEKSLTQNVPQQLNVNFVDTTVFTITGRTFQMCTDCYSINGNLETQTCALDSVAIWKDNSFYSYTNFIDTAYGRYGVSITDPGIIKIEPRYNSHAFDPVYTNVNVTDNVSSIDFRDTTTHTISGKLTAGCSNYIGTAVLEFSDSIPNDANGNPRTSCFRKRVTTNAATGTYSIRLPARIYKVRVISFTSSSNQGTAGYIAPTNLMNFINEQLSKDLLIKNITTQDAILNIEYERPPELNIVGLNYVCGQQFAVMQQAVKDSFTLRVNQGNASFGCPVKDTSTIRIFTSIQAEDNTNQELRYQPVDTGIVIKLTGGTPYIISPYYKVLNIQFTDKYGRQATQISKNVVVTGVKADVATFTTVSPEIPMLILHDPPGDNSYSYWQSNQSIQTALRLYSASSNNVNAWLEAKIGAKFEAGIGVSTESAVWGTINGAVNVGSANTTGNETILTTSTSQYFSTSSDETVTGSGGDVYIGAALNLIYAGSTEIKFGNCQVTSGRKLIVANNGFATQYIYTEDHIKNVVIPTLNQLAENTGNTAAQIDNYHNQARVWQQVLDNNATNKSRAVFDKNISFSGSAGPTTNQTTSSVSKSSTVEFNMSIDATLAAELGFEIGGSGASGGVSVAFKTETGNSTTNTTTKETTIGYTLDDNDNGDYFSVNIKKDPVYSTPVFELAAGTTSCPHEETSQPRDEMQFTVPVPLVTGVAANGEAQFVLRLGNTSQSLETRTYQLSFDQASNTNGAIVTIGGSPVLTPISYTIGYLGEVQVTVTVKKATSSNVFSYEGLKFILTDACSGDVSKTALISAGFVNQCSPITLAEPENGWLITSAAHDSLKILLKDYNVNNLSNVTLEYSPAGTSSWTPGFTIQKAQLNPIGANGTEVYWNVHGLADTAYNIRLKLNCSGGAIVYSQRASGFIDRKAPALYGNPQPTDDNYVNGDVISFSYNEKLNINNLNNGQVTMRRLSNNQLIPVTVSGYDNKIVIVPNSGFSGFGGDSIRVIVKDIADQYGNVKSRPDTSHFILGNFVAATGNKALTLSIINPVVDRNTDSIMKIYFNLPANAPNDIRVNYSISGTARVNDDYTPLYNGNQPAYTTFNGAQGTIVIPQNSRQAVLRIDPRGDSLSEPLKTIIISLSEGGDYGLGAANSVSGQITSAYTASAYTFIGNGDFNIQSNWLNNRMPPSTLGSGKEIIINPSGVCNLTGSLIINQGAKLTVKQGKQFNINGSLELK